MNENLMVAELRRDEGVRYSPYNDTLGNATVGVGHEISASPLPADWTYPLSDGQVDQLLDSDLQNVYKQLDAHLPWWRQLDEVRQRVIANMTFNMGIHTLLTFHNTLAAMQSGDYAAAATGMQASAWYKQVGARAQRLVDAMDSGVMPDEPAAAS